MGTLQLPALYLLLFCFLSLIKSQEANTDAYAFNYLIHLDKTSFHGAWHSISSAKPFATFEKDSGLFASDGNKHCDLPVYGLSSRLTIYDGKYLDGGSHEISICQAFSPSFHFDPANVSMIGMNVTLNVSSKDNSRVCASDVSIYFIERESSTPMTNFTKRDKRKSKMGIQLFISSPECSLAVTTDVMTPGGIYDQAQELIYDLVYTALVVYGTIQFVVLNNNKPDALADDQISALTMGWRFAWAIFFFFYNITIITNASPFIFFPAMASVVECFLTLLLTMINLDKTNGRREKIYLLILMPWLLIIWTFTDSKWIYLSSILYLVPQIIKIYRNGEKSKINLAAVLMFLPSQVFAAGYFGANPDNFTRMEPSPFLFFIYFVLAAIQVIILNLQRKYHSDPITRNQVRPLE